MRGEEVFVFFIYVCVVVRIHTCTTTFTTTSRQRETQTCTSRSHARRYAWHRFVVVVARVHSFFCFFCSLCVVIIITIIVSVRCRSTFLFLSSLRHRPRRRHRRRRSRRRFFSSRGFKTLIIVRDVFFCLSMDDTNRFCRPNGATTARPWCSRAAARPTKKASVREDKSRLWD